MTVVLVALTLGMLYAHVLEMGPKLGYPPDLYTRLNNSLYLSFATVGAVVEVGALVATVILTLAARRRERGLFVPAAVSSATQVLVLVLWFAVVAPVNSAFSAATPGVPAGFEQLRTRWETGHAINAALMLVALVVLVAGLVRSAQPAAPGPAS